MNIFHKIKNLKDFLDKHKINYKKYIFITIISVLIGSLFSIILPYIAKLEIDQLQYKHLSFLNLDPFYIFIFITLIYFFLSFIETYISFISNAISEKYYEQITLKLSQIVIDRINNSEYGKFFDNKWKEILNKLTSNLERILKNIIDFFSHRLSWLVFLTAIFYIFSQINIYIVPILFLWVFIQYKLENYLQFLNKKRELWFLDKNIDLWRAKRTMFWYPVEVIISGVVVYLKDKMNKIWNLFIEKQYELEKKRSKYHTIWFNVWKIIEVLIKISVWYSIFYYGASIWTITMTILFSNQISNIFRMILNFKKDLLELNYKLDFFNLFIDFTYNKHIWNIKDLEIETINIKNLNFAYPNLSDLKNKYYSLESNFTKKLVWKTIDYKEEKNVQNPNILENININFKKWNIYWIIGKNWAWKTTLLNLLLKSFNTNSIYYNNKNILDIKRDFFIKNVWIITQIPFIIPYSIKENITLWKEIDDKKIYEYLELFNLKEKIENLPKKLESKIWEDIELSWWERQIIAIIRILIQDYQILILDEWSNQLDVENENKLIKLLHQIKKDKIIIFVTHRMTVINKADFIYCLNNKTIEDAGTPQELLEKDSLFKQFYNLEINRI